MGGMGGMNPFGMGLPQQKQRKKSSTKDLAAAENANKHKRKPAKKIENNTCLIESKSSKISFGIYRTVINGATLL